MKTRVWLVLVDHDKFGGQTTRLSPVGLSFSYFCNNWLTIAEVISTAPYFPNGMFVLLTAAPPGKKNLRKCEHNLGILITSVWCKM